MSAIISCHCIIKSLDLFWNEDGFVLSAFSFPLGKGGRGTFIEFCVNAILHKQLSYRPKFELFESLRTPTKIRYRKSAVFHMHPEC